jgi:hypothetical protein
MWPKARWLEVGAVLSFPTYEENQTRIFTLYRKGKLTPQQPCQSRIELLHKDTTYTSVFLPKRYSLLKLCVRFLICQPDDIRLIL